MATVAQVEEQRLAPAEAGQLAVTWKRFRRHRLGLLGFFTLILLVLSSIVVPMISGYDPNRPDGEALIGDEGGNVIKPALWTSSSGHFHLIGTDEVGRDNLTRLFYGGRISLAVGLIT